MMGSGAGGAGGLPELDARKRELLEARMTRHGQGTSLDGFLASNVSNGSWQGSTARETTLRPTPTADEPQPLEQHQSPEEEQERPPKRSKVDDSPPAANVGRTDAASDPAKRRKSTPERFRAHLAALNRRSSTPSVPPAMADSTATATGTEQPTGPVRSTTPVEMDRDRTVKTTATAKATSKENTPTAATPALAPSAAAQGLTAAQGCRSLQRNPSTVSSAHKRTASPQRKDILSYFGAASHSATPKTDEDSVMARTLFSPEQQQRQQRQAATDKCQSPVCAAEIQALQDAAQKAAAESKKENETLEWTIKELKTQLDAEETAHQTTRKQCAKARETISGLLISETKRQRKLKREKCDQESLRLVSITYKRRGHEYQEYLQEGYAFAELNERQVQLNERKKELEAQRKQLNKRRPTKGKDGDDGGDNSISAADSEFAKPMPLPPMSVREWAQRDEILKLQVLQLKKDEGELLQELTLLDRARNLHLRELKRIRDEDRSVYKDYRLLHERYLLLELIGKGGFSEVYKAFDLDDMRHVACKIHSLNSQWTEEKKANYTKHACREFNIHKALNHPHIVRLLDVFEIDHDAFCTVLEYCEGNDLDFVLKQNRMLSEREARSIIVQMFDVLNYLNRIDPPVIHYDLKPANILYKDGEIKITDFGLSKVVEEHSRVNGMEMELTSQGAGTYWYLPPETFVITSGAPPTISSKVDVWSAGVIFYQCLYGKRPFGDDLSQQSILQQRTILNAREVAFPPRPAVSNETKAFIKRCLTYRKEDRPDVLAICQDPYLQLVPQPKQQKP